MDKLGLSGFLTGHINPSVPSDMFIDYDDFVKTPVTAEDYTITQATAGTAALDAAADNGVILLDSASQTAAQGIQIQRTAAAFKPAAGKHIYFETYVKIADTATGPELFIGLAEIDTTVIASSAVSTANHIGFSSVTDNNVLLVNSEKAGAGTTGTGYTLVDSTWTKLAFRVNGVTSIDFFVNDDLINTISTTANIPIVAMAPTFVCQSGGTTDPILHVDYWVCQKDR